MQVAPPKATAHGSEFDDKPAYEARHKNLEIGSDKVGIQLSPRTKDLIAEMNTATRGDRASVDELTKVFLQNRRLGFYAFATFFVFAAVIIGLTAAIVQGMKETRVDTKSNVMMTYDGKRPAIYSSGYELTDISSEMSPDTIANVDRINFMLGNGKNSTLFSLRPTGFALHNCDENCTSVHTLHMFTAEGMIIYHGSSSFIVNPSDSLQIALNYHGVSKSAASKSLKVMWGPVGALIFAYRVYSFASKVNTAYNAYQNAQSVYSQYQNYRNQRGY